MQGPELMYPNVKAHHAPPTTKAPSEAKVEDAFRLVHEAEETALSLYHDLWEANQDGPPSSLLEELVTEQYLHLSKMKGLFRRLRRYREAPATV